MTKKIKIITPVVATNTKGEHKAFKNGDVDEFDEKEVAKFSRLDVAYEEVGEKHATKKGADV